MQTLLDSGIAMVIAFQGLGDWLIAPMRFFSQLGTEEFFFLVLPMLYWSVDSVLGIKVGLILVTSNTLNSIGKLLFAGPRPYWVSSHVRGLWTETSFGVPSGHAQHAMSVWGMIAMYYKKTWAWIVCGTLIFLIGVSRIFLGAHFPQDVLIGWLLGAGLLWAFGRFWDPAAAWISQKKLGQQIFFAFLGSMIFLGLGMGAFTLRAGYELPTHWIDQALLAGPEEPDPVNPEGIFTSAGTFFGLTAGLAWIHSLGGYQASGPVWKRVVRYLLGLIGVLVFWMGLGAVFPRGDGFLVYALRFLRYSLVGWWVTGGAPWVFQHFKLSTSGFTQDSI